MTAGAHPVAAVKVDKVGDAVFDPRETITPALSGKEATWSIQGPTGRKHYILEADLPAVGTQIENVDAFEPRHRRGLKEIMAATYLPDTDGTALDASRFPYVEAAELAQRLRSGWNQLCTATVESLSALVVDGPAIADLRTRRRARPVAGEVVESEVVIEQLVEEPPAYRAFKDLVKWLEADEETVANALGFGRTTPRTWKQEGREPRARTVRSLYEYHSTLDILRRRLGDDKTLRAWIFSRNGRHRDALLAGDLAAVQKDVDSIVFSSAAERLPDLAWAPEESDGDGRVQPSDATRPSGRRPRRARLR